MKEEIKNVMISLILWKSLVYLWDNVTILFEAYKKYRK